MAENILTRREADASFATRADIKVLCQKRGASFMATCQHVQCAEPEIPTDEWDAFTAAIAAPCDECSASTEHYAICSRAGA